MDGKEIRKLLARILSAAICASQDVEPVEKNISPEVLTSVYHLAQVHDLGHIVSWYIHKYKLQVHAELMESLRAVEFRSVFRCEQMKHTLEEICGVFETAGIPYIPLKGSVIRPFYPVENMRTSCDIDILIREEDVDLGVQALREKGYQWNGEKQYHDVPMFSPGGIHLELHFSVLERIDSLDEVLKDAWKHAVPAASCQYKFEDSFFAFYTYAHMAYHFLSGGCGLRALMDIWVMEHNMNISYSCASELLHRAGLYRFAAEMSDLANRYFAGKKLDSGAEQILEYIYRGGVYGSKANNIALFRSQGSSTLRYMIQRVFLPYRSMVVTYPVLNKMPYLLPIYWVVRWIRGLMGGKTGRLAAEIACAKEVSLQQVSETKDICDFLGL